MFKKVPKNILNLPILTLKINNLLTIKKQVKIDYAKILDQLFDKIQNRYAKNKYKLKK